MRLTLNAISIVWIWAADLLVGQAVVVLLGLLKRPVACSRVSWRITRFFYKH